MPKLSVLIAAFNEDAYIYRCLENIVNEKLPNWDKEIILVDDGSSDSTLKLAQDFSDQIVPIKIIHHSKNKGKGAAIKTAVTAATGDVLIIQDADLEYDPHDYHQILKKYDDKKVNVVYGSRILGERLYTNRTSSIVFYWGGKCLSLFINGLFKTKITDQPTCYKSWRSNLTKGLLKSCKSDGFELEIEMTAYFAKNNIKIVEVPIHYYPRTVSFGKKIGFKDFIASIFVGLRCYFS